MGDLVPNLWDQLDLGKSESQSFDVIQDIFNNQVKRQMTSRKIFLYY